MPLALYGLASILLATSVLSSPIGPGKSIHVSPATCTDIHVKRGYQPGAIEIADDQIQGRDPVFEAINAAGSEIKQLPDDQLLSGQEESNAGDITEFLDGQIQVGPPNVDTISSTDSAVTQLLDEQFQFGHAAETDAHEAIQISEVRIEAEEPASGPFLNAGLDVTQRPYGQIVSGSAPGSITGDVTQIPGVQIEAGLPVSELSGSDGNYPFVSQIFDGRIQVLGGSGTLNKRDAPKNAGLPPKYAKMADKGATMPSVRNAPPQPSKDEMYDAFSGRGKRGTATRAQGSDKNQRPPQTPAEVAQRAPPPPPPSVPGKDQMFHAFHNRGNNKAINSRPQTRHKGALVPDINRCNTCGKPAGQKGTAESMSGKRMNVAGMNAKGGKGW
ncbi:hypothetical protein EX30DRAFT_397637 [Ascodesmis nigricans]|uniref:Uncharacterized protein n=1 Tax=Ascodesmis nigricans TaxID=341454 RepID=A0A4S2MSE8_9PEZI|nr:hypothetical protein EX30DRAFT_397637 [Ascodesmis nigricans]